MAIEHEFRYTATFSTRWNDNDVYGHINNTVYYVAMDTVINAWFIERAGLAIEGGDYLAVCASSSCDYLASAGYPDELTVGFRPGRIGRTSITWEVGIFRAADERALATGRFVHVFVDRENRRPIPIPSTILHAVERDLAVPGLASAAAAPSATGAVMAADSDKTD